MNSFLTDKVNRISRRFALVFRITTTLAVLLAIGIAATGLVRPDLLSDWANMIYPKARGMTTLQISGLTVFAVGQIILVIMTLWSLTGLFECLSQKEPLSLAAATRMRLASRWLLAATLYAILIQVPASIVASFHLPPGHRFIALSFNPSQISGLLASFVFFTVASLQELAAQMNDDHRQII